MAADPNSPDYDKQLQTLYSDTYLKKPVKSGTGYSADIAYTMALKEWEQKKKNQTDKQNMSLFENHENLLLEDPQATAFRDFTPTFIGSNAAELRKKADMMSSIFSARKDEILKRKAAPGITQTRYEDTI